MHSFHLLEAEAVTWVPSVLKRLVAHNPHPHQPVGLIAITFRRVASSILWMMGLMLLYHFDTQLVNLECADHTEDAASHVFVDVPYTFHVSCRLLHL